MEKKARQTETSFLVPNHQMPFWYGKQADLRMERAAVRRRLAFLEQSTAKTNAQTRTIFELVHHLNGGEPADEMRWVVVPRRKAFDECFAAVEEDDEPCQIDDNRVKAETTFAPRTFVSMWDMVRDELHRQGCVSYISYQRQSVTVDKPDDFFGIAAEFLYGAGRHQVVSYCLVLNCGETRRRRADMRNAQGLVMRLAGDPLLCAALARVTRRVDDTTSTSSVEEDEEEAEAPPPPHSLLQRHVFARRRQPFEALVAAPRPHVLADDE